MVFEYQAFAFSTSPRGGREAQSAAPRGDHRGPGCPADRAPEHPPHAVFSPASQWAASRPQGRPSSKRTKHESAATASRATLLGRLSLRPPSKSTRPDQQAPPRFMFLSRCQLIRGLPGQGRSGRSPGRRRSQQHQTAGRPVSNGRSWPERQQKQ